MKRAIGMLSAALGLTIAIPGAGLSGEETSDTGDAQAEVFIEEILVTARRREENIQDVPIAVTALSSEDLKDRAADDLRDLSRLTPNLDFQSARSASNTAQVYLRGIGQENWAPPHDPKIGIYMDGVHLARSQGSVFDFLDVDRVEVLRGPQGTLFGRNTTAGLIHVISNRPGTGFDYSLNMGFGNHGQARGSAMLNLPLGDTLSARMAFQHLEADGYVENVATGEHWNDENSQMARVSLRWMPNDRFMADLIVDLQRTREMADLGSCEWSGPVNGAQAAPGSFPSIAFVLGIYDELRTSCEATQPYKSTDNDPNPESNVDALGLALHLQADIGFATLTSISSWRDSEDFNGSWGWATDTVGSVSYIEALGVDDNTYKQWSQELRLSGTSLDESLDWVLGAYIFSEEADNTVDVPIFRGYMPPSCAQWPFYCATSPVPGVGLGQLFYQAAVIGGSRTQRMYAENDSQAIFGEVIWRFADRWSLTAGIRYTWDEREFVRTERLSIGLPDPTLICPQGTPPEKGTTCYASKDFDEATPRAILSYKVNDDVMLYAGWSRGYSSGGFNQDVRMRPYEPEISDNLEGGIKSTLLDNRLVLNLTAFHNSYENQQLLVGRIVGGQPTVDVINAREATLYGLEGEMRAELPAGFYVLGSFGLLDGEYEEFTVLDNLPGPPPDFTEIITERDLKDSELIRGSPSTLSIALGKHHRFANGSTMNVQVGWASRGRSYHTLEALRTSRQDDFGLLDGRLVWTFPGGRTSIALWGTNLLDEQYFSGATDLSGAPSPFYTITKYWGEPRRFGVDFTYRFAR